MKREDISDALNLLDSAFIQHTEAVRGRKQHPKRKAWFKRAAVAACLFLLCITGIFLPQLPPDMPLATLPQENVLPLVPEDLPAEEQETFVPISSLLAEDDFGKAEQALQLAKVKIGPYQAIYTKAAPAESTDLSESIGAALSEAKEWYQVSGHTDLQYLIRKHENAYSLWKFQCFDSDEYPYSDVLRLVYQIDSAEQLTEVQVAPATMDNSDTGKRIQAEIGTCTITDKSDIEILYQILSSLTCYGADHWDMINYGNVEAASDTGEPSSDSVRLGRYLTLTTSYGNEIDGLKYTAVSNMFYEFSGIAYNKLTNTQADSICNILRIDPAGTAAPVSAPAGQEHSSAGTLESPGQEDPSAGTQEAPGQEHSSAGAQESPGQENPSAGTQEAPGQSVSAVTVKATNPDITLEAITELQNIISNAMINRELPFVSSSAIYEKPYRLHIVVTSDSEENLAKLKAFDTIGGALEIEYSQTPNNLW